MLVRSKTAAFINGRLLNIKADGLTDPFEYKLKEGRKLSNNFVKVGEEVKPEEKPFEIKTKNQIMAELSAADIKFNPVDKKEVLEKLLDDYIKEKCPGNIKPLDKTVV